MPTAIYDRREAAGEERSSNVVSTSEEIADRRPPLKDVILSFSLSNLCFLLAWRLALAVAGDPETKYFEMAPPSFGFVASLLADIYVGAAIIYLIIQLRRRFSRWRIPAAICLGALCCFALFLMEQILEQQLESFTLLIRVLAVSLGILGLFARHRVKSAMKTLLLLLAPLLPLLTLDAAWLYSRPELKQLGKDPVAGRLPSVSSHRRLIWIIFDELDYHLAFETPPKRLHMPEFDRLRQVSLSATGAHSPAGATLLSLPSLLAGERATSAKPRTNEIALRFEGSSEWHDFSTQPNILRRARAAGLNTAVDGWHHPYCRLIGRDLSACINAQQGNGFIALYALVAQRPLLDRSLAIALWEAESLIVARDLYRWANLFMVRRHAGLSKIAASPGPISDTYRGPLYRIANIRNRAVREQQISAVKLIMDNAVQMAEDPDLNLVFIHAPAPHLPGIWNSRTGQFTSTGQSDYVDNLALTDFFLGQVRQALEKNAQWDQTTILISADHPFRPALWQDSTLWTSELAALTEGQHLQYVPFILKLPGQTKPFPYHRDFNTVVSGDLIWEILNGRIEKPEQVSNWLDAH